MILFAHRGDREAALENTRPALMAALLSGADGVETDLRLTRDGEVVLLHDATLTRTAGVRRRLSSLTLAEAKALSREAGSEVVTLSEFWEIFRGKMIVNLEIKERGVAKRLPALLGADAGRRADLLVTSSIRNEALLARRLLPGTRAGAVVGRHLPLLLPGWDAVSIEASGVTKAKAARAARAGTALYAYTVNDAATARRLAELGVGGLFTDRPVTLRRELAQGEA